MRMSARLVAIAALLTCLPLSAARAQRAGTNVAVIDINKVFQENVRFKKAMSAIEQEVKQFDEYLQGKRKQFEAETEKLRDINKDAPEYRAKEAAIAKMQADLQVEMALKKKDVMEREAKVYYSAYVDVQNLVAKFANRYSIGLVLRYNSAEIDAKNRVSVLQGVNRAVVYHDRLDITQQIIDALNALTPPAETARKTGPPPIPGRRAQ